jgi:hypothetical protein
MSMNDYHDRLDEPHQGEDRPVAGWPGRTADDHTDEQTGEHTGEHAGETRDEEEPLVGEVWNDDTGNETDGERDRPADVGEAERTEDTTRDHVAEPFGTEEPVTVNEPAAEESEGQTAEPSAVADPPETTDAATDPDVEPVAVAEPIAAEPATEPEPEATTGARPTEADDFNVEYLVQPEAAERLRNRWRDVKAVFVDDPADAVRQAGALSGEAVDELSAALGRLREELEGHTGEGAEADTERLRVTLRGYGSLIDRILTR